MAAKTKSKRQQIMDYLTAHPKAEVGTVAEKFGASKPTVYQYRRELRKLEPEKTPEPPQQTNVNGDMTRVADVLCSVQSLCQRVGGADELRKYVTAAETLGVV